MLWGCLLRLEARMCAPLCGGLTVVLPNAGL